LQEELASLRDTPTKIKKEKGLEELSKRSMLASKGLEGLSRTSKDNPIDLTAD
jgi:hypothetical protein